MGRRCFCRNSLIDNWLLLVSARFIRFGSAKVVIVFSIVKRKFKNLFETLDLFTFAGSSSAAVAAIEGPCFVRFGSAKVAKKGALSRGWVKDFPV
jgi:hypothetical protein